MSWCRRLIKWFRGGRREAALVEELEAHRVLTQDELERSGFSPADAAAESRRRMGNIALAREDVREVWTVRWADRLYTLYFRWKALSLPAVGWAKAAAYRIG